MKINNFISLRYVGFLCREIGYANRIKILLAPMLVFITLWVLYFWPTDTLYSIWKKEAPSIHDIMALYEARFQLHEFAILLLPLYFMWLIYPYLQKLNYSVRINLLPVTKFEQLLTIWLFAAFMFMWVYFWLRLVDGLFVEIIHSMYWEQVQKTLEAKGNLYEEISYGSYFYRNFFDFKGFTLLVMMIFYSAYLLGCVFYKRYSLLKFIFLITLVSILILIINNYTAIYQSGEVMVFNWYDRNFVIIGFNLLLNIAFYFKLKEKEI